MFNSCFVLKDPLLVLCLCVCQTGESGGETEGMGTQESVGGGGAARLLYGAFSRP